MSSQKVINGSILPLMLGSLMMIALVASVINDQRYGESLQPGFDSLTARVVLTRYTPPAEKAHSDVAQHNGACDINGLTEAIDKRVLSLPAKVTAKIIGSFVKRAPLSLSI